MTAPTTPEELKPCGNCCAPARWVELAWRVKCTRPSCGVVGGEFETRREAEAAWNTRPADDALRAENERLREALTPSGYTKAAYIGEFRHAITLYHPRLGEDTRYVDVPWTTIKEIMAAIRERAALAKGEGE